MDPGPRRSRAYLRTVAQVFPSAIGRPEDSALLLAPEKWLISPSPGISTSAQSASRAAQPSSVHPLEVRKLEDSAGPRFSLPGAQRQDPRSDAHEPGGGVRHRLVCRERGGGGALRARSRVSEARSAPKASPSRARRRRRRRPRGPRPSASPCLEQCRELEGITHRRSTRASVRPAYRIRMRHLPRHGSPPRVALLVGEVGLVVVPYGSTVSADPSPEQKVDDLHVGQLAVELRCRR